MNIIARLEYELAYYDSAVHRFNHYTTRTSLYTGAFPILTARPGSICNKLWNMRVTDILMVIGVLRTVPKDMERGWEVLEIGDYSKYSIVDIGQNTEKSPRNLTETCCHLYSSAKTMRKNWCEKFAWSSDNKIQTARLISARRPDVLIVNNKNKKRDLAELWTLPSRRTKSKNLKKKWKDR